MYCLFAVATARFDSVHITLNLLAAYKTFRTKTRGQADALEASLPSQTITKNPCRSCRLNRNTISAGSSPTWEFSKICGALHIRFLPMAKQTQASHFSNYEIIQPSSHTPCPFSSQRFSFKVIAQDSAANNLEILSRHDFPHSPTVLLTLIMLLTRIRSSP